MAFCNQCGNELSSQMKFCPKCGNSIQGMFLDAQNNQAEQPVSAQQTPNQNQPAPQMQQATAQNQVIQPAPQYSNQGMQQYPNQGMQQYPNQGVPQYQNQRMPYPNQPVQQYPNQRMPQMQQMPNQRVQQYPNQPMQYPNQGMPPVPPMQPYPNQAQQPKPKKKKKWVPFVLIPLFSIFAIGVLLVVFIITAFLFPGFLRKKPKEENSVMIVQTRPTTYDDSSNTEALLDYADRLEKQGNLEAAANVRKLAADAAMGDVSKEIGNMDENVKEIKDTEDLINMFRRKGGE